MRMPLSFNQFIAQNALNSDVLRERSAVKQALGDQQGAADDLKQADELDAEKQQVV